MLSRAAGHVVSAVTRALGHYARIILSFGIEYCNSTVSRGHDGVASVFMGGQWKYTNFRYIYVPTHSAPRGDVG